MAKAVITTKNQGILSTIEAANYYIIDITDVSYISEISANDNKVKTIKTSNYPNVSLYEKSNSAKIIFDLPFKVKFTNIGIEGYSANNVPPIGIAIIGFNNYIL